jgi:uncharacterized protein DUF3551
MARVRIGTRHGTEDGTHKRAISLAEIRMRGAILVLLTASGMAVLGGAPAEAVGTRYPFCIQGDDQPGLSNCTFTSYEQCQATASGRMLWCVANPYFVRERDDDGPPSAYRPLPGRALPPAPGAPRY